MTAAFTNVCATAAHAAGRPLFNVPESSQSLGGFRL